MLCLAAVAVHVNTRPLDTIDRLMAVCHSASALYISTNKTNEQMPGRPWTGRSSWWSGFTSTCFSFSISYFLCLSWFQSSYGLILDTVDFTHLTLDCGNSQLAISTTHMALNNNMHWLSDNKIEWLSAPWRRPNSIHRCISSPPGSGQRWKHV